MPLDFPSSPSLNDTYTYEDRTWIWNGSAWILKRQINDTVIGNSTPSTGAFTTLSSTGSTTLGDINSNLIPAANITYNLGNSTNRWNDLWLANSTIHVGAANISADGANLLLPSTIEIGNAVISESGGNIILPAGTTVGGSGGGGGLPLISNVQITDSSWNVLDDLNIKLDGGYIIINGSGFEAGAQVLIGNTAATSVSVVSSSVIRSQIPAKIAGSYLVYVVNPDGGTAILINAVTYSDDPNWITLSPLINQAIDVNVSLQLSAELATSYSVEAGSSLPPGIELSSGGLLSGTVTGVATDTTYNFTIIATDAQLQDTPKAFSVTFNYIAPAALYEWGVNYNGDLGLNDRINRSSPTQVGTSTDWYMISKMMNTLLAGTTSKHTSLAIKKNGTLWTWGVNNRGQLGTSNTIDRSSPVQVGSLTNWSIVSAPEADFYAIQGLKYDGTLWTWGGANSGSQGLNDRVYRSSPTQVGTDTNWKYVSSGASVGAIRNDGTLWTWGPASSGILGLNNLINRSSPTQVGTDTDWASIQVGGNMAAIKTNGTLWMWGSNTDGQLGLGNLVSRSSPVQVGTSTDWAFAQTDGLSSFGIKTNGTLWAWGDNRLASLGLNDTFDRNSPVQVGTDTNWKLVKTMEYCTIATKTDGTLWTWGDNRGGQQGTSPLISRSSPNQVGSDTGWNNIAIGAATRIV